MNEDDLLEHAVRRYEQETKRNENIELKASNQIGFVGVIVGIFGFVAGQGLSNQNNTGWVILLGLCVLILSIFASLLLLYPKKKIPALNITLYLEDIRKDAVEEKLIDVYAEHIDLLTEFNFTKSKKLKLSYLLTFIGITISFIGVIVYIR